MKYYCGVDLGSRESHICVVDQKDKKKVDKKTNNDLFQIMNLIEPYKDDLSIVVETTFNWDWIVDGLIENGYKVKLAHAFGVKAIAWAKRKTDKIDAFTLARLLRADLIPEGYIYPKSKRPLRDLVRVRVHLVEKRSTELNSLRWMFTRYNLDTFSRSELKKIKNSDIDTIFNNPLIQERCKMAIKRIALLNEQIKHIESIMVKKSIKDECFKLLLTIPGIGEVLALTILYEVGDISRFASSRVFSSYCRVVPGIYQSSKISRRGRNSKQGNPYLKHAFSQAACAAVKSYKSIRIEYERRAAKRKKAAKLVSRSIVSHKLALAAYYVLRDRKPYNKELMFNMN